MFEPPRFFCRVRFVRQTTQIAALPYNAALGLVMPEGHSRFRFSTSPSPLGASPWQRGPYSGDTNRDTGVPTNFGRPRTARDRALGRGAGPRRRDRGTRLAVGRPPAEPRAPGKKPPASGWTLAAAGGAHTRRLWGPPLPAPAPGKKSPARGRSVAAARLPGPQTRCGRGPASPAGARGPVQRCWSNRDRSRP